MGHFIHLKNLLGFWSLLSLIIMGYDRVIVIRMGVQNLILLFEFD